MALTPEQIDTAYRKVWSTVPHAQRLSAFALEIESEVRKEYTELIQQMRDALAAGLLEIQATGLSEGVYFGDDKEVDTKLESVLAAANARLVGT